MLAMNLNYDVKKDGRKERRMEGKKKGRKVKALGKRERKGESEIIRNSRSIKND